VRRGQRSRVRMDFDVMDEIGFECHFLLYFNSNTNVNADLVGYKYKTNSSNPDTFSI
jgi:hypothetical protein